MLGRMRLSLARIIDKGVIVTDLGGRLQATALRRRSGPRESVTPLELTVYFPPRVEN